jgi:hypothetical protein
MYEVLLLINQTLLVCFLAYIVYTFVRIRAWSLRWLQVMEVDEILNLAGDASAPLPADPRPAAAVPGGGIEAKREKLVTVIVGGQAERWLGRAVSLDQVDKLTNAEVEKYYTRYEMCQGAAMASTLGRSILTMHSDLVAHYEPELDQVGLTAELEANPIVEVGLNNVSCKMFYMFSGFLAPLVTAFR